MSTPTFDPPAAGTNGHDLERSGVRTYRGRKLEELIPQIREELGPDAIILRQREGLTGGVGGFFAQRCVEVEAQAMPKVDVYDDDASEEAEAPAPEAAALEAPAFEAPALEAPALDAPTFEAPALEAAAADGDEAPAADSDEAPAADSDEAPERAPAPPTPEFTPAAPVAPELTPAAPVAPDLAGLPAAYEAFAAKLEEAAAQVGDVNELLAAAAPEAAAARAGEEDAHDEPTATEEPLTPEEPAAPEEPASPEEPTATEEPLTPEEPVAREVITPPAPTPTPAPAPTPTPAPAATAPSAIPAAQRTWTSKQIVQVDPGEAAAVEHELISQGISQEWADELIVAAAAHRLPLMRSGGLRDAVRATLAATIPAPAPLTSSGAAIAFVGAGGAGKTRCTAALAAAYARAGTLAASVVSIGSSDWGNELKDLLKTEGVWVSATALGSGAEPTVSAAREGGLVVIDTVAAAPGDAASIEALAAELEPLVPDAVYIAVPATFSVHAATKLIEGFAPLGADGIAVTHADEADQLGIAAELAYVSGMPIAYIHEGSELGRALAAADPSTLAARLLP